MRLGEICVINPKAPALDDDINVSFVPMPKVGENGEFDPSEIKKYHEVKKGFTYFRDGDILFAKITPCMENGKGAIARSMENGIGFGSTEFHVLRPENNVVIGEWVYYLLNWSPFRKEAEKNMTGSAGQKRVPKSFLENFEIALPDTETQKNQVKTLQTLDILISLRKQQLAKLDELVKARFVELFGDPVDNPMGWATKQLQELVTDDCTISYGIVQTGDDQEEGVPVFRPVDIVNRIPVRSELKKTTEEISNKYKRTILKGREMLIPVRANIADTCIVGEEFAGCNVGRGIVPIRTREDEIILEFLKYQIDSKHLNDNIKALAKGITLIQLNMEDLREVNLIVPPIEQQKNFVEFAKQTDKSKSAIQKSLEKLETLKGALMQKYFG